MTNGEGMMKHRGRSLLTNAAANWAGFAAQLAVALLLAPVLVHALGDRRYGVWSLVESILAYLMLFDLGVAASVVRYVARFEAAGDRESLNRVVSTSICIFAAAGLAVLALVLAIAGGGMQLLKVPADLAGEACCMLLLLGFNLAVGLPLGVFPSILDGLERYPAKTAIRTAALVVRSAALVLIVRGGGGLVELAWAITVCNLGEHLAMAGAAWYYLPGLRFSLRLVDRATFRMIRGYSLHAFLALLAGRISFQTDALVIGALLAPQYITFFALAARLVEYAKNALRAVTSVLTPAVSALDAQGNADAIRRVLLDGTRWVLWLILPIQAGLLILGKPFLTVWLGPRHAEASYPTLAILAAPLALALAQSVSARILYGLGQLHLFVRVVIAEALANLLLSVALAEPLGIEGVAWGTTIPNVVANVVVLGYVCRTLGVGVGEYVRRAFLRPCAVVLPLAAGWMMARAEWEPASWPGLLTVGLAGLGGYAAVASVVEVGPRAIRDRVILALARRAGEDSPRWRIGLNKEMQPGK
ncbi:MAG TPA: oligosaccharide flippase family protein [Gemmataceae bacterium]|nr:oligosaccharide flippase family protein [Gemmataceae bacterium]